MRCVLSRDGGGEVVCLRPAAGLPGTALAGRRRKGGGDSGLLLVIAFPGPDRQIDVGHGIKGDECRSGVEMAEPTALRRTSLPYLSTLPGRESGGRGLGDPSTKRCRLHQMTSTPPAKIAVVVFDGPRGVPTDNPTRHFTVIAHQEAVEGEAHASNSSPATVVRASEDEP
jgi:hypothetical protein